MRFSHDDGQYNKDIMYDTVLTQNTFSHQQQIYIYIYMEKNLATSLKDICSAISLKLSCVLLKQQQSLKIAIEYKLFKWEMPNVPGYQWQPEKIQSSIFSFV